MSRDDVRREGHRPIYIADPPRTLPAGLVLRLLLGGIAQFGWIFGGFGLVFVWIFALNADLTFFRFWGGLDTAQGVIRSIEDTRFKQGGSRHRGGTPVYRYTYTFVARDGVERGGTSYRVGGGGSVGQRATVEFPAGDPGFSRLRGMRRAVYPMWAVFPVLFPAIGAWMVAHRMRSGARAARLLCHGRVGYGRLKAKAATNVHINDKRVYKLTFEFRADDGQTYGVVARTNAPEPLEDDDREIVLYDPDRPSRAVLLDSLPARLRIDESGEFRGQGSGLLLVLLPAAVVIGHAMYLYMAYLR